MHHFDQSPTEPVLREFTICRDRHGHWLAVEAHGLLGGVFLSSNAAERFALREVDGDSERVYVVSTAEVQH